MLPKFEDFLYPFLLSLKDGPREISEVKQSLKKYLHISEDDCKTFTKNGKITQFSDRIGWSRQYFRRALFIEIPKRGQYELTDRGKEYLNKHSSLKIVDLLKYSEFEEFANRSLGTNKEEKRSKKTMVTADITPTEAMDNAFEEIEASISGELKSNIMKMSPSFFEKLVVDLLVAMGYGGDFENAATVTQQSRDGGIDGVIKEDTLGLDKIYIQAKRWATVVGVHQIRDFGSALDEVKASKGIFITTSDFSSDAKNSAQRQSKKIVLINGCDLTHYMIRYNVGVSVKKNYIIKKIDTDYFDEEE